MSRSEISGHAMTFLIITVVVRQAHHERFWFIPAREASFGQNEFSITKEKRIKKRGLLRPLLIKTI
ncbi:MAG TPA: hypothetical protein DCR71_03890 [Dehalococcoidia bacterium]|nr:hypothetical protein [Dehalococcoidia bacterium]